MIKKNKKLFPTFKKKLRSFMTDESGKITKKDALGLAAGAVLLSGVDEVSAGTGHHSGADHTSGVFGDGHANVTTTGGHQSGISNTGHQNSNNISCTHASGIVNGHFSNSSSSLSGHANGYQSGGHASGYPVSGHGSHGSSGSGSGSGDSGDSGDSGTGSGSGY